MGISRQMTLLGFCGMGLYGLLLSQGHVSPELLPQFSITALLFCFSGRIMEKLSVPTEKSEVAEGDQDRINDSDWLHLTNIINWIFALALVYALVIFVLMPTGMSSAEMFDYFFGSSEKLKFGPAP
ncbi:MAG: hypothetical protein K0A93_09745 [Desulfuromonadaceae bacterium]|nr:hypothetical protein [Desulfuromonadaceae bacterium]